MKPMHEQNRCTSTSYNALYHDKDQDLRQWPGILDQKPTAAFCLLLSLSSLFSCFIALAIPTDHSSMLKQKK